MCLSGTPSLYKTLTSCRVSDVATELMDQLFSRIGLFRALDALAESKRDDPQGMLHTPEDIRKVFAR